MERLVHLSTGAGSVRCGRSMRHGGPLPVVFHERITELAKWDLATATADPRLVTCPACDPLLVGAVETAEALFEDALNACDSPLCGEDETVIAEDARLALVACYDRARTPELDRIAS